MFHSIVKEQVNLGQLEVQRANANTTEAPDNCQAEWHAAKRKRAAQKPHPFFRIIEDQIASAFTRSLSRLKTYTSCELNNTGPLISRYSGVKNLSERWALGIGIRIGKFRMIEQIEDVGANFEI